MGEAMKPTQSAVMLAALMLVAGQGAADADYTRQSGPSDGAPFPTTEPGTLPHPSGHRTRKAHKALKARRKRGRKGRKQ